MKILIYLSGIAGIVLFVLRMIGLFSPPLENNVFLYIGSGLIFLVFIPLLWRESRMEEKRINKIIESYKEKEKVEVDKEQGKATSKGWSMNNSPFRSRRSGLSWGGGNLHAANAKRGERKSFLR